MFSNKNKNPKYYKIRISYALVFIHFLFTLRFGYCYFSTTLQYLALFPRYQALKFRQKYKCRLFDYTRQQKQKKKLFGSRLQTSNYLRGHCF